MQILKIIIKKIKTSRGLKFLFKNLVYLGIRSLMATYRLRVTFDPAIKTPLKDNIGVFYFWHQQIIAGMTFFFKNRMKGYCIVSPSNDGQFAGYICQHLGFSVLYGSSHKSSVQLVRQALTVLNKYRQLCVVGDGSRGPAFKLQDGLVYLAQKSQVPLVFIECSSSCFFSFNKSWDKFQIPLPFSKIFVHVHAPSVVQRNK